MVKFVLPHVRLNVCYQGFIQDFLLGGGGGTIETFTHRGCQACITEIMTSEIQIEHKLATIKQVNHTIKDFIEHCICIK